jgi:hypothetical protein
MLNNLNKLATEIHQNAVAHGFYDAAPTFAEIVALIHSELSEALEEYRAGHKVDETYYTCDGRRNCTRCISGKCGHRKPEGVPSELADVIIRILDYCGYKGYKGLDIGTCEKWYTYDSSKTFPEFIAKCHFCLSEEWMLESLNLSVWGGLKGLINMICDFCEANSIDINVAITEKMSYNKGRPHKHGKVI